VTEPASRTSTQVRAGAAGKRLGPALTRYRVMAYVTGCFLLLLCAEMIAKYGFRGGESWLGSWIAITHGWIYVIYLCTVVDLWSKLRWSLGRLVALVLAGVVPLLSFFAERRTTADVRRLMADRGES
jgi:integral membrane protein